MHVCYAVYDGSVEWSVFELKNSLIQCVTRGKQYFVMRTEVCWLWFDTEKVV